MPVKKKVTKEGNMQVVAPSQDFAKSNSLISAKYRASLVECKLMSISLSQADKMVKEEVEINGEVVPVFTSTMYSSDLTKQLGVTSKNLPTQLRSAYTKMAARQIGVEENGEFMYRNLFIGSDYKNGVFKLYYNPLLGNYYRKLSSNFTMLNLEEQLSFRSIYSFRLHEVLKQKCYGEKTNKQEGIESTKYTGIRYSVAEMKLMMGTVEADSTACRNVLNKTSGAPDYERAVEVAKDKTNDRWADFKRYCIDPAVKEINAKTSMHVEYETEKSGQGGKVHSLIFSVTIKNAEVESKEPSEKIRVLSEDDKLEFILELKDLMGDLTAKDLRGIAEASSYDLDKCKRAFDVYRNSDKDSIDNPTGFIIRAIQDGWEPKKKAAKKNPFNAYKQNEYDYDELEAKLISNF